MRTRRVRPHHPRLEAAAAGGEVLLVDADTYGGAVAHANAQEHHR